MTAAYLAAFGFESAPFSKEVADADLWLPSSKEALVDELHEAVAERSSVILVGEPGVGKTCVLRALRHRLPQAGFRLTYCHNATLGRHDFYRQLSLALGLSAKATATALLFAVSRHVEDLGAQRIHPVFLLDEAHLPHQLHAGPPRHLLNYNCCRASSLRDWQDSASTLAAGSRFCRRRTTYQRVGLFAEAHHRGWAGDRGRGCTASQLSDWSRNTRSTPRP